MKRGQSTLPETWLVADERVVGDLWRAVRALPRGSGILFLYRNLPTPERTRVRSKLRRIARQRDLVVVDEAEGEAARVHSMRELRKAGSAGARILFLSPMFPTRSHPDWEPLPRMRAATLARLANAPVIALGGMDERRFRSVAPTGFSGWAAIDAWLCA